MARGAQLSPTDSNALGLGNELRGMKKMLEMLGEQFLPLPNTCYDLPEGWLGLEPFLWPTARLTVATGAQNASKKQLLRPESFKSSGTFEARGQD